MVIRRATMQDLGHVYTLLNALRMESVWRTIPIEPIEPYVHSKLLTIMGDPKQRLIVAEYEGVVVGICRVALDSHEYLPGLTYLAERDFYVVPRLRGYGIGKALWNDVMQWGKAQGAYGACYGRITVKSDRKCIEEIMWRTFSPEAVHA